MDDKHGANGQEHSFDGSAQNDCPKETDDGWQRDVGTVDHPSLETSFGIECHVSQGIVKSTCFIGVLVRTKAS